MRFPQEAPYMPVTASAPGKLLLLGDHAVVHNRPCLVTAVDLRYHVTVEPQQAPQIDIITQQLSEAHQIPVSALDSGFRKETAFVHAAVASIYRKYGLQTGLKNSTNGPPLSYG